MYIHFHCTCNIRYKTLCRSLYNAAADSVIRLQNTTSRLKLYLKTLSESRKKF